MWDFYIDETDKSPSQGMGAESKPAAGRDNDGDTCAGWHRAACFVLGFELCLLIWSEHAPITSLRGCVFFVLCLCSFVVGLALPLPKKGGRKFHSTLFLLVISLAMCLFLFHQHVPTVVRMGVVCCASCLSGWFFSVSSFRLHERFFVSFGWLLFGAFLASESILFCEMIFIVRILFAPVALFVCIMHSKSSRKHLIASILLLCSVLYITGALWNTIDFIVGLDFEEKWDAKYYFSSPRDYLIIYTMIGSWGAPENVYVYSAGEALPLPSYGKETRDLLWHPSEKRIALWDLQQWRSHFVSQEQFSQYRVIFVYVNDSSNAEERWKTKEMLHDLMPVMSDNTLLILSVPQKGSLVEFGTILAEIPLKGTLVHGFRGKYLMFCKKHPEGPHFDIQNAILNLKQANKRQARLRGWRDIGEPCAQTLEIAYYASEFKRLENEKEDAEFMKNMEEARNLVSQVCKEEKTYKKRFHLLPCLVAGLLIAYLAIRYFVGWQPWHKPVFLTIEAGSAFSFLLCVFVGTNLFLQNVNITAYLLPFFLLFRLQNAKKVEREGKILSIGSMIGFLGLVFLDVSGCYFGAISVFLLLPLFVCLHIDFVNLYGERLADAQKRKLMILLFLSVLFSVPLAILLCYIDLPFTYGFTYVIAGLMILRLLFVKCNERNGTKFLQPLAPTENVNKD